MALIDVDADSGLPQTLRAFAHRNFRLYWFGMLISLCGSWMQLVALNWLTYRLTNSPLMLGLINFVALLPVGALSLVGGVISDRFPRRNLILATQVVLACQALILAVLTGLGRIQVWHIMLVTFIIGAANVVEQPARSVLLMDVVGKDDFTNAVGLNAAVVHTTHALGPALAGVLIVWLGETSCFVLNFMSYLAVILSFLRMQLPESTRLLKPQGLSDEVAAGLKYIWQNLTIRSLIMLIIVSCLLAQPVAVLMPVMARDVLQIGSAGYGLLMSAHGAGAACGALISGSIGSGCRGKYLKVASLVFPVFLLLFAVSRSLLLSLGWLFLAATGQFMLLVMVNAMLQLAAGENFQGRVASFFALLNNGLNRLGGVPMGAAAQAWGAPVAIGGGAALSLIWAIIVIGRIPLIRQLR